MISSKSVALPHPTRANKAISFFSCAPIGRTTRPPQAILYLPTANRLLIAITSSDLVILSGQSVPVVYSYLRAPPLHFKPTIPQPHPILWTPPNTNIPRSSTISYKPVATTANTTGSLFATKPINVPGPFGWALILRPLFKGCLLPFPNIHTSFCCWSAPVSVVTPPTRTCQPSL